MRRVGVAARQERAGYLRHVSYADVLLDTPRYGSGANAVACRTPLVTLAFTEGSSLPVIRSDAPSPEFGTTDLLEARHRNQGYGVWPPDTQIFLWRGTVGPVYAWQANSPIPGACAHG
jgi:hypothetical protein